MNRVDELIRELAPSGVKFRPLGTLGRRNSGTSMTAAKMKTIRTEGGSVRIFAAGQTVADVDEDAVPAKAIVREPSIIVKSRGHIGFIYYERPFTHKAELWSYTLTDPHIDQKFVYYYLLTRVDHLQEIARATSVKLPQLGVRDTDSLQIPVPPIEVQREIVRILDQFTQLEVELEVELEARRRLYAHYRAELLRFDLDAVETVSLSEGFETRNGYTPSKSDTTNWANGTVPWFRMEDIRENGRVLDRALQMIPEKAVKGGRYLPANSLIFATSATIGEHALITVPYMANQRFTALWPKPKYAGKFDMKFLFYYGFVIDEWCRNNTTTSSFASVDMSRFKRLVIPVPPIEAQKRIAEQLDKFDALVNDLSIGLPAELIARRKQYEYYRDKLLTFQELAV